ncbi:anaerobic ribonucleoside-triphosphate reductase [Persicobacter sp. CCB-QB2]|uniref:anaerobic ribonucleoside-triphosphate reductase n=1 Tax=Persicobacter sp. CCB-QB2 TaxID=1561025 RepID=UPI0006A9666E|nr:anaerobic ribonucleoside-triphosphate reductase [Persicobacter sp. CCB-QB2]
MNVIKRSGAVEPFEMNRISIAVGKAGASSSFAQNIANEVQSQISSSNYQYLSVYDIERLVEDRLMFHNEYEIARSYIEYRKIRAVSRQTDSMILKFADEAINLSNIENENANMPEHVFTAKLTRMSSEVSKEYAKNFLIPKKHIKMHEEGWIYFHDFNSYAVGMQNCMFVDLGDLMSRPIYTSNGSMRPPRSIRSAMQLVAVIFQCQSNCQFGGIASNKFDYDMAPFIGLSFKKHFANAAELLGIFAEETLEIRMENEELEKAYPNAYAYALNKTREEAFQAAEALIHNLNHLESRAGNQLPFVSINYGTDTSPEGRLVIESMLRSTLKGIGKEFSTPIFPIQIWKYKKGVSDEKGRNADLLNLAIECTTKRVYPNYVNVDAEVYEAKNPDEEAATMGCRTRNGVNRHGSNGKSGRGNLSPITINLPKLAIEVSKMEEGELWENFFGKLSEMVDTGVDMLTERLKWQKKQLAKSAPFMYRNDTWKGGAKLADNDRIGDTLNSGTLAVGFIGLAETLIVLMGKHHGEDAQAYEKGQQIIQFLYEKVSGHAERTNLNLSLYATPAESLCHKFAKLLKKQYGEIKNVSDKDYITNSFHIPVWHSLDAIEKVEKEAFFHNYCTGGSITYVELNSDISENAEILLPVIKHAMEAGVYYFAMNIPYDECLECGDKGLFKDTCPSCGSDKLMKLRRVTGYITGNYRDRFNNGKQEEVHHRVKHDLKQ